MTEQPSDSTSVGEQAAVEHPFDPTQLAKPSSLARFAALLVDEVIAAGPMLFLGGIGYYVVVDRAVADTWPLLVSIAAFSLAIFWPVFYMLTRDGWGHGQGFGKRLFGLVVIKAEKGGFATKASSAVRFIILAIISLVEAIVVLARPDGRRIGDVLADTRVSAEEVYAASGGPGADELATHPASKTWPVVMLVISAMMVASSVGLVSFFVSRLAPAPVADRVAGKVYGDPDETRAENTIKAYYDDVLSGSYDAALARMDMPQDEAFVIVSVYSGADAILDDYVLTESGIEGDEAVVSVDEVFMNDQDERLERQVLYVLRSIDGTMLITAVTATEFDPLATARSPEVRPRDAEVVVDAFLGFLAVDDPVNAKPLASTRFIDENPQYFDGSLGELVKWDILGSEQLTSERMRVRVQEDWASGSRTVDYQADLVGEELKVDTVNPVN